MSLQFTRDDQVLYYLPEWPKGPGGIHARQYVLWPAFAYRVVAPVPRDHYLNFLEKAILGMFRSGLKPEETSELLCLRLDLVSFIARDLTDRGLVALDGIPTEQGIDYLEKERSEKADWGEVVVGWVFQDPWTGQLWPRFHRSLENAEVHYQLDIWPELVFGSRGRPYYQKATMVLPADIPQPNKPKPADIIRAVRSHQLAKDPHQAAQDGDEFKLEEDLAAEPPDLEAVAIERVSFVQDLPERVFLVSYLHVPAMRNPDSEWYACDFFGLSHSPRLRRAVDKRMQDSPALRNAVDRLLAGTNYADLEIQKTELRSHAASLVKTKSSITPGHPLWEPLVQLEYQWQRAMRDRTPESDAEELRAFVGPVLADARRMLEKTLKAVLANKPITEIWPSEGGIPDPGFARDLYNSAASQLGFDTPLPQELLSVKPMLIQNTLRYPDGWKLRAALVTILLCARVDDDHPFWEAANDWPALLEEINQVARYAGEALHDKINCGWSDCEKSVNIAYRVVNIFARLRVSNG